MMSTTIICHLSVQEKMEKHLAGESLVSRRAAALLHLKGPSQAAVVWYCHFHADFGDTRRAHLGGVGCSDQDVIQVGQDHQQVFTCGGHAVRTTPVLLHGAKSRQFIILTAHVPGSLTDLCSSAGPMLADVIFYLSEDNLKPLRLSGALLPPLPRLTSHQSDVIALRE